MTDRDFIEHALTDRDFIEHAMTDRDFIEHALTDRDFIEPLSSSPNMFRARRRVRIDFGAVHCSQNSPPHARACADTSGTSCRATTTRYNKTVTKHGWNFHDQQSTVTQSSDCCSDCCPDCA